jgi:hypothetical protein
MHNNKSSSSQIFLSGGKFEKKSVDTFTIDAPDELSPLTALEIGHDNSGMGPGWYLDKVCLKKFDQLLVFFSIEIHFTYLILINI